MNGGARPGAGRKVGWRKGYSEKRKVRSLVAHDDEWLLIKKFADLVKHGNKSKAENILSQLEG